jgi:hypothetical protein
MHYQIAEIVKQYVMHVREVEPTIKARISKLKGPDGQDQYQWEISHNYRPSKKAGGVYYPSTRTGRTLQEVEGLLMAYMASFTPIDVTPTKNY